MKVILALLVLCVSAWASEAYGQSQKVKILNIAVDSKPVPLNFEIIIHKDEREIHPNRDGDTFEVPPDIGADPVSVQIKFKDFDLWFSPVYPQKFSTNWIVGVDRHPFDEENIGKDDPTEIKMIYYLQFVSEVGDDTRLVVTEKKRRKCRRVVN